MLPEKFGLEPTKSELPTDEEIAGVNSQDVTNERNERLKKLLLPSEPIAPKEVTMPSDLALEPSKLGDMDDGIAALEKENAELDQAVKGLSPNQIDPILLKSTPVPEFKSPQEAQDHFDKYTSAYSKLIQDQTGMDKATADKFTRMILSDKDTTRLEKTLPDDVKAKIEAFFDSELNTKSGPIRTLNTDHLYSFADLTDSSSAELIEHIASLYKNGGPNFKDLDQATIFSKMAIEKLKKEGVSEESLKEGVSKAVNKNANSEGDKMFYAEQVGKMFKELDEWKQKYEESSIESEAQPNPVPDDLKDFNDGGKQELDDANKGVEALSDRQKGFQAIADCVLEGLS